MNMERTGKPIYLCLAYVLRLFQTRQETVLDIVQDRIVIHDGQILGLSLELLVGILAGTTHHGVWHLLCLHLLVELTGGCSELVAVKTGGGPCRHIPLSLPRRKT